MKTPYQMLLINRLTKVTNDPIVQGAPACELVNLFSGSGTTIVAAEITGRACHAIELMPSYFDVAFERWQAFTSGEALLEGDRLTFAKVRSVVPLRVCRERRPPCSRN
jgi:hypothetical protein